MYRSTEDFKRVSATLDNIHSLTLLNIVFMPALLLSEQYIIAIIIASFAVVFLLVFQSCFLPSLLRIDYNIMATQDDSIKRFLHLHDKEKIRFKKFLSLWIAMLISIIVLIISTKYNLC